MDGRPISSPTPASRPVFLPRFSADLPSPVLQIDLQAKPPKLEEPKLEEPKLEPPKVGNIKLEEPKLEEPKLEPPKVGNIKLEAPKPKLLKLRGLIKLKREKSDPPPPCRLAEWNYKTKSAEILVDGKMLVTKQVRAANPALKGESRMIAIFDGGLTAEVAAAWFWMADPPARMGYTTPVFRPIVPKRGKTHPAHQTLFRGPHRWVVVASSVAAEFVLVGAGRVLCFPCLCNLRSDRIHELWDCVSDLRLFTFLRFSPSVLSGSTSNLVSEIHSPRCHVN